MSDPYFAWSENLSGRRRTLAPDEVCSGLYRNRGRAYRYETVDGNLVCVMHAAGKPPVTLREDDARQSFPYCWVDPQTPDAYSAFLATGTWPDQHEAVTILNAAPPDDSLEALRDAIDALAAEARRLIKAGAAPNQIESDRAADIATRLSELASKADKSRETEKRPHLEAGRQIDGKWKPVIAAADVYKDIKRVVITPFLNAENARLARERAEAERKHREQVEAQRQRDAETIRAAQAAGEAVEQINLPTAFDASAYTPVTAGTRGRAIASKTFTSAEIEDYAAALAYFGSNDKVREVIQSLADAQARAGIAAPGCKIKKEKRAS
jgi:hypothetical protein